jgi:hypothetical protein
MLESKFGKLLWTGSCKYWLEFIYVCMVSFTTVEKLERNLFQRKKCNYTPSQCPLARSKTLAFRLSHLKPKHLSLMWEIETDLEGSAEKNIWCTKQDNILSECKQVALQGSLRPVGSALHLNKTTILMWVQYIAWSRGINGYKMLQENLFTTE